jgi:endoglucanase
MTNILSRYLVACGLLALTCSVGCASKTKGKGARSAAANSGAANQPLTSKTPGELKAPGENPLQGAKWYVDRYATAVSRANAVRKDHPDEAALLDKIAKYGGADWVGDWTPYVGDWIRRRNHDIEKQGALPLYIAYNLPNRDCGQYSKGGVKTGEAYRKWIEDFARGIGDSKAVVILEPDALGQLTKCLSDNDQKERLELFKFAISTFNTLPQTYVYVDAGHSKWMSVDQAVERLKAAGAEAAQGFALNVSNYRGTDELIAYGKQISAKLGGKHFVIDTSRNGNGPPTVADPNSDDSWCNPPGRALGTPPTTQTADPVCDAYLWLKKPGESDGECNGGPKAGQWFNERALELARNAKF